MKRIVRTIALVTLVAASFNAQAARKRPPIRVTEATVPATTQFSMDNILQSLGLFAY